MDVSVQLYVLMIILRHYDLPDLSFMIIILQTLMICRLEGLVIPGDALKVVDGELSDLAVLLILLKERLEGIVAEEGDLHQVFKSLHGHGTNNIISDACKFVITQPWIFKNVYGLRAIFRG